MKIFFSIAAILLALHGIGQSSSNARILKLSADIFHWETEKKIDSLKNVFADKFVVVNAAGESQTKEQYLTLLRSGNFEHDSIDVEQNNATVVNNTATVVGKGKFVVTANGSKHSLHLSYIEVFTRANANESWKILAMHASVLQK